MRDLIRSIACIGCLPWLVLGAVGWIAVICNICRWGCPLMDDDGRFVQDWYIGDAKTWNDLLDEPMRDFEEGDSGQDSDL